MMNGVESDEDVRVRLYDKKNNFTKEKSKKSVGQIDEKGVKSLLLSYCE
jgi:hypothetical protein